MKSRTAKSRQLQRETSERKNDVRSRGSRSTSLVRPHLHLLVFLRVSTEACCELLVGGWGDRGESQKHFNCCLRPIRKSDSFHLKCYKRERHRDDDVLLRLNSSRTGLETARNGQRTEQRTPRPEWRRGHDPHGGRLAGET